MANPVPQGDIAVTVRYFAAARAAARAAEERFDLRADATMRDVRDAMVRRHGAALDRVLTRCSFLLNEVAAREPDARVRDGDAVDVLPPFAGG